MSHPPPPPTFFLPPVPRHQVPPLSSSYIFRPTCYSSLAGRSEFRNCPPSPSPSIIRGNHPPESPSILRGDNQPNSNGRPNRPPLPRHLRGLQRLSVAVQVNELTVSTNSEEVDSVWPISDFGEAPEGQHSQHKYLCHAPLLHICATKTGAANLEEEGERRRRGLATYNKRGWQPTKYSSPSEGTSTSLRCCTGG